MKTLTRYILLLILTLSLTSAGVHKFYVSVWQLEHKPEKQTLQITGRIFIDDLDKLLETKYGKKFYLATDREIAETTATVTKYIADKMTVKVNGKAQALTFLAKEVEDDVLLCYLTVPAPKKVTSVEVRNTLLQDLFAEQQNITHIKVGPDKKSLLLTKDNPNGTAAF
ncbi:hypothetical protein AM493_11090 [Flavobacterium akiainvivens]|uniref:Peptidase E n=1 Tax=Flavobacterium akiainvivens TaxID=1202724 RepID=A0A0M9VIA8_9FLAO|nr:DUF6702 family protein [Flavobacterium akiainvivens]KOS06516.1 hypothetical protein AM493_11090 [Flavobacterium akiainvivens]SFQ11584.1 hypothetical protein SAMN05444144_101141 [Flavobacterium akiainvivens]